MNTGVFVVGTGTDVGKTYVTARLVKALRDAGVNAGYFKAALSGAKEQNGRLIPGDAAAVCEAAGLEVPPEELVPYIYRAAVSPHLAARLEGRPVERETVEQAFAHTARRFDFLVAEGSGGLVCPLRYDDQTLMLTDVIRMTGFPCLLVSSSGLGSINAAVLSAAYAKAQGLPLRGVVLNGFRPGDVLHEDNRRMMEALTGLPVVACLEEGAEAFDREAALHMIFS